MSKKKSIFLIFFFTISFKQYLLPIPVVTKTPSLSLPSKASFLRNAEFTRSFRFKKITVAEYITDPLILYTTLWGCFAITLPVWEKNYGLKEGDQNYWKPDSYRGFDYFAKDPKSVFITRVTPEPFGANHYNIDTVDTRTLRIDPITKEVNGVTVLRNDFYAKNIIEPIYFTYLALYLRSKNYHPAIFVAEMILLSVLYEFTVRPFYMNASLEQLLKNPAVAVVFAILLDELSTFLLTTPYKGLHILAYFLNPFNALPNARVHPLLFFDPYKKAPSLEAVIKF